MILEKKGFILNRHKIMILGIGIDLLKVSRIKKILDKYGELFVDKIFSNEEIKKNKINVNIVDKLAKSFSVKEAFVKALGTGFIKGISLKDITLKNEKNGKPIIHLSDRVNKYLKKITPKGYNSKVYVSISDEKDYVISNVIISLQDK